ncbi:uncharacterized protein LOC120357830 isoform X1 [Solenopsis invicta]|uniref:uncharacterized protein LOC120357830 isoform X1 n=2 Tax=Solenopsis invicta TaxID=13686 RepID=UPI00193D560D|nr:uncharacterized protein LOC120357830 isoform X1 [Solenopsis invicta]
MQDTRKRQNNVSIIQQSYSSNSSELADEFDADSIQTKKFQQRFDSEGTSDIPDSPKNLMSTESSNTELNSDCTTEVVRKRKEYKKTSLPSLERHSVNLDFDQDIKTILNNIYLRMDKISSKLDVSIINQTKLMTFLLPHEKKINRPNNLPALPLQSINDLRKFEKYLREPENMSATIKYISFYGSDPDETKATMNVMKKLMYNCLAKNINFKGLDPNSSKIPLEQCHMWDLIQGVVMCNKKKKL